MTFRDLYGDALDTELGSADRTQLFTVERRQAAIQAAQREFVHQTECTLGHVTLPVTSGDPIVSLDTVPGWLGLSRREVALRRTHTLTGRTTTLTGPSFVQRAEEWADQHEPGWRDAPPGVPQAWWLEVQNGRTSLRLMPAPAVPPTETWNVLVPYVRDPDPLVADHQEPFQVGGQPVAMLRPYHYALAHYGASVLERLRRDLVAAQQQMLAFSGYVAKYLRLEGRHEPQQVVVLTRGGRRHG